MRRNVEKLETTKFEPPIELTDRNLFLAKARAIVQNEHLLLDQDSEKLFGNEQLVERLMQVTQYAQALLQKPGENFANHENGYGALPAFRKWERAVFDFYSLLAPAIDVNDVPAILRAEKHTGLKSLSREKTIWTSQMSRPRVVKSQLSDEYLDFLTTEGKTDEEKAKNKKERENLLRVREDIERWFGPAGLLLHTAVASWAIETTVENLQRFIESEIPAEKQNKWHKYLKKMSSKRARVWLNLHDLGRLVTHDPYDHAVLTHVISEMAELPRELYNDYDLPNILELGNETPLVDEFIPPEKDRDETEAEYDKKTNALRVEHVDGILETLEEMAKTDPQYENPVSVLMFWLIDAYTKLYDIRGERTLSSRTDHIDPREVSENFSQYGNLQPGDEAALFLGRFQYRLSHSGGDEDSMSENEKKIFRYYSRQYELARSIFVWLQERLGIPKQLLWNLIFDFTERNDKHIDENGDFNHHPADPHTDIWKSAVKIRWPETTEEKTARLTEEAKENSANLLDRIRELRLPKKSE